MDRFDIIYYINLDKREDRKKEILQELEKMDVNMNKVKRIPGVIENLACLGCSKAHLNALLDFEKTNHNNCLILEDDFMFLMDKKETNQQLNKFWDSGNEWDVLMLSGHIKKYQSANINSLYKVNDGQTTSGYSVNRHYLPKLIQNYREGIEELRKCNKGRNGYCIDMYWKRLQPESKWFIFYPKIGKQRPGYSDIEKRVVDYRNENRDIKVKK